MTERVNSMKIEALFPIPFGMNNINRPITEAELEFVNNQPRRNNVGNWVSVDHNILNGPPMIDISNFIHNSVYEYFTTVYNYRDRIVPYITLSWANYTDKEEYHHTHNHSNSLVSGVFYMNASEDDTITLFKDHERPTILLNTDGSIWSSREITFKVNTGNLILFPSHIYHRVDNVKHDRGTRISIAFNVFIKGIIGSSSSLNQLML